MRYSKTSALDFTNSFFFQTREEMVEYYRSIDFLVIWYFFDPHCWYRHSTKILNAASFGIPSLGQPIDGYKEVEGYYLPINDIDEIVYEAVKFKDDQYYQDWSNKLIDKAEEYHISKTTELYKQL